MKVCADCFADEEIKNYINAQGKSGVCDVTDTKGLVIDPSELEDFLVDLINLYDEDENGKTLAAHLFEDTQVFASKEGLCLIMQDTIDRVSSKLKLNQRVSFCNEVNDYKYSWDKIKKEVLREYRYFSHLEDSMLKDLVPMQEIIPVGTTLYRARITPDDKDVWGINEMGCPPVEKTKAGRANPAGIPYLYLCKDDETPLYETRTSLQDRVTIGKFEVEENLKVVNLSAQISLYRLYLNQPLIPCMQKKIFFDKVREDMSKPKRSVATEIEYVPTQLVCEYCKRKGYDGICFNSSLNKRGVNVVVFKEDKLNCVNTYNKVVTEITIKSE